MWHLSKMDLFIYLLFILTINWSELEATRSNPLKDPYVCGRPSCEAGKKFKYKFETRQKYSYTIDVSTKFDGASENASRLHITSKLSLSWLSRCEGLVTLSEVALKETPDIYDRIEDIDYETPAHDNSPIFATALEEHPLRFSFEDGIIAELCPEQDEPTWVLNFKRGILSMLHNSMDRLDVDKEAVESDIHGDCPTSYRLQGAHGTSLVIEKTKDLGRCKRRQKFNSVVQTVHYDLRMDQQKPLPLVRSSVICDLSVDHNVYNRIECRQTHLLEPFSGKKSGAVTTTTQKLTLLLEEDDLAKEDKSYISRRTHLLYDHLTTPKPTIAELKTARRHLKELCDLGTEDGHEYFSETFSKYIRSARLISHTALYHLYRKSGMVCSMGKKHFLDALPYLGSSASVELIKTLIIEGNASAQDWLISIALIPRPTESMLDSLLELVEHFPQNRTVSLSVSSVAHSFCSNTQDCEDNQHLSAILDLFIDRLSKGYQLFPKNRQTQEEMLISLKSIANIGINNPILDDLLMDIVMDKSSPVEIRLAAVYAYRRFPCKETSGQFLQVLSNQTLDSEVRIAAYLQVMKCPNYLVVEVVRYLLENEQVNQVGSFIWSHLNNLIRSSRPSNLEIQTLLYGKELNKKFSSDVRRFSSHFERSFFFNQYNLGGSCDSNLIFSTKSYVPRSVMVNLTLDIFGESINVLELNARLEGLEYYAEKYLGPKGPVNKIRESLSKLRLPRNIIKNGDEIKNQIDQLPNVVENNNFVEPKISLGLKLFGNELKYVNLEGEEEIRNISRVFDPMQQLISLLSGNDINYNKASMFMDTSYVIPTGAGLPLDINVIGTSSIQFHGSLKGAHFFKKQKLDLLGKLKPSATVTVLGSMSVDAYYAATTIKLKTNIRTSTSAEGSLKIDGQEVVAMELVLPKEKSEIISANSELIVVKGDEEQIQKGAENETHKSYCSSSWACKILGLALCTNSYYPKISQNISNVLVKGPLKFSLTIPKADPTANIYRLELSRKTIENITRYALVYDTPASKMQKHFKANLTLDKSRNNFTLSWETDAGLKSFIRGKYKCEGHDKYAYLEIDTNGKKNLDFGASLSSKESKNGRTFSPRLYMAVHNERIIDLNGTLKYVLKLFQGTENWDVDLNFNMNKNITTTLDGYLTRTLKSLDTKLTFGYQLMEQDKENMTIEFKSQDKSGSNLKSYQTDLVFQSSEYSRFNLRTSSKVQSTPGRLDAKLDLNYGTKWNDPSNIIALQYMFVNSNKNDGRKLNTYVEIKQHSNNINWKLQMIYDQIGASTHLVGLFRYATNKDIVLNYHLYIPRSSMLFVESKFNFTTPSICPVIVEAKIHEKITKEYDIELKGQWINGYNISARGRYQDTSTITVLNQYLKFIIQSNRFDDINTVVVHNQDKNHLKLEAKAHHDNKEYSILAKHSNNESDALLVTLLELKADAVQYRVVSTIELKDHQQITLDVHLDDWRDVLVKIRSLNGEQTKDFQLEVKWDVNRDPDQKLLTSLEYRIPGPRIYTGKFNLSYPKRTFVFTFDYLPREFLYNAYTRMDWNYKDFVELKFLSSVLLNESFIKTTMETKLSTSFVNLERITFRAFTEHNKNRNGLIETVFQWNDQCLSASLTGDYEMDKPAQFLCNLTGSIKSTFSSVPSLKTNLKHFHNPTKLHTELSLGYNYHFSTRTDKFQLTSTWDKDTNNNNFIYYSGVVSITNPFYGYKNILYTNKLFLSKDNNVKGVMSVDLDLNQYAVSGRGHWTKLTDNMLVFNVTTPYENHQYNLRLGLSAERRHLVAEMRTPEDYLGIEMLYRISNVADYNIKFILGTPLQLVQHCLIVAKKQKDRIDYRVALNQNRFGLTAIWYFESLLDFEHAYRIYTPVENYEETSIVARIVLKNGLDSEMSATLGKIFVGILVKFEPKENVLQQLGFVGSMIQHEKRNISGLQIHELLDMKWNGLIQIEPYVYPSIKTTVDLEKKDNTLYNALLRIRIPQGDVEITDELNIFGPSFVSNSLKVATPFAGWKKITCNGQWKSEQNEGEAIYGVALDVNVLRNTNWKKTGVKLDFIQKMLDKMNKFQGSVLINTPSDSLPFLKGTLTMGYDGEICSANVSFDATNVTASASVRGKMNQEKLDTTIIGKLETPILKIPSTKLQLKTDNTKEHDSVDFVLETSAGGNKKHSIKTYWNVTSIKEIDLFFQSQIPMPFLEDIRCQLNLNAAQDPKTLLLDMKLASNYIYSNTSIKNNIVRSSTSCEILDQEYNYDFNGTLDASSEGQQSINGILVEGEDNFNISANIDYVDWPYGVHITIVPPSLGGPTISFNYTATKENTIHKFTSCYEKGHEIIMLRGQLDLVHKYFWSLNAKLDTPYEDYRTFDLSTEMKAFSPGNVTFKHQCRTPVQGLESTEAIYSHLMSASDGAINLRHSILNSRGVLRSEWIWRGMEDWRLNFLGHQHLDKDSKHVVLDLFYKTKMKTDDKLLYSYKLGAEMNVDQGGWVVGANASINGDPSSDIDLKANLKLPTNIPETHCLELLYRTDNKSSGSREAVYLTRYYREMSDDHYGLSGKVSYTDKVGVDGNLKINWGKEDQRSVNNIFILNQNQSNLDLFYSLKTPNFDEETLKARITFEQVIPHHNLKMLLFYPGNKLISELRLNFMDLDNMFGHINLTIPTNKINSIGTNFNLTTNLEYTLRKFQVFWTNNTALFQSESNHRLHYGNLEKVYGIIVIDFPIKTRHKTEISYNYVEEPERVKGSAEVDYNNKRIGQAKYNCDSKSKAGVEEDVVKIEIENSIRPIVIDYVNIFEYSASGDGSNLPTKTRKQIRLFDPKNKTAFDISTQVEIKSNFSGESLFWKLSQGSQRDVSLTLDYDIRDQTFLQKSNLNLSPSLYFGTDLAITNKTLDDSSEAQDVIVSFSTPKRNFTLLGSYNTTNQTIYADSGVYWNTEDKAQQKHTLQTAMNWIRSSATIQEIEFKFIHPSFEKNVTLKGTYKGVDKTREYGLDVDYCNDPKHRLVLTTTIANDLLRQPGRHKYDYSVLGSHPNTNLDLFLNGTLIHDHENNILNGLHDAKYKKKYFPLEYGFINGHVDFNNKRVSYTRETRVRSSNFYANIVSKYPEFGGGMSRKDGGDVNEAGELYLNIKDKSFRLRLNMTEDGSQSFNIIADIPNGRSSSMQIWRDYDDIRVVDASHLLKLNHSRLVVSSLRWRPELKNEIKTNIRDSLEDFYFDTMNTIDYWNKYIRFEIVEEISDVWEDSKGYTKGFLDDVKALKVLREDLVLYEDYINDTYHRNGFYIKDINSLASWTLDELTSKSRNETMPKLIDEIMTILGASGFNIVKTVTSICDNVKTSYDDSISFLDRLFSSDPMHLLRSMIDRLFEKTDEFCDDVFISTLKYINLIYAKASNAALNAKINLVEAIQPALVDATRSLTQIAYHATTDFIDYINLRMNELIETPYFVHLSNYMAKLDQLYRDLSGKNALMILYNCASKALEFVNQRFLPDFPLAAKVEEVVTEINKEWQVLKKNPTISYYLDKLVETNKKTEWLYEYINGEKGMRHIYNTIYSTWADSTLTAMDAENKYRAAKSKFIYDAKIGLLHLEQKLPMSWHAFNETPRFEEIPEVKAVAKLKDYFTKSNKTFWTAYYDYKPYTEIKDWFPPFRMQALIIGNENYFTFDRKYYRLGGSCSYLLARDFLDKNFSLAVTYDGDLIDKKGQYYKLHLVIKDGTVISIDIFSKTLSVGKNKAKLPLAVNDNTYIYQEADILTVESRLGYSLRCNMKYQVCTFGLSGWYFGKTAGLLGTNNNEHTDDFLSSNNEIEDLDNFTTSWSLTPCKHFNQTRVQKSTLKNVQSLCESLFASKISPFQPCYHKVDAGPFRSMCVDGVGEKDVCMVAIGYMESCRMENTPLRIPDSCVKCRLANGTRVNEGTFVQLTDSDVPKSTDVVFIVEAKDCNANIRTNRSINALVSVLQSEFNSTGLIDNRFGLVVFGGNGIYNKARSVAVDNNVFVSHSNIGNYFDDIQTGNGTSDIFDAINFAARLDFRAGVSKTFILVPCSNCTASEMQTLDYAALHQLLREYEITLHILMNHGFQFDKGRINKKLFGIDYENAYTKNDAKTFKGDSDLRRQTKISKSVLGLCAPLSLETNGSVFTARKLELNKRSSVKLFASVFGKRVALTAMPSACQTCECNTHDHGIAYMECFPCRYPSPSFADQDTYEDITSSISDDEDEIPEYEDVEESEESD